MSNEKKKESMDEAMDVADKEIGYSLGASRPMSFRDRAHTQRLQALSLLASAEEFECRAVREDVGKETVAKVAAATISTMNASIDKIVRQRDEATRQVAQLAELIKELENPDRVPVKVLEQAAFAAGRADVINSFRQFLSTVNEGPYSISIKSIKAWLADVDPNPEQSPKSAKLALSIPEDVLDALRDFAAHYDPSDGGAPFHQRIHSWTVEMQKLIPETKGASEPWTPKKLA